MFWRVKGLRRVPKLSGAPHRNPSWASAHSEHWQVQSHYLFLPDVLSRVLLSMQTWLLTVKKGCGQGRLQPKCMNGIWAIAATLLAKVKKGVITR
eukprot:5734644-Alexandrium_andersonii.AAC.1